MAGTRMIRQGMDGLYIGDMLEGFLKGGSMLSFVLLHKGDIEVSPPVLEWI